MVESAPPSAGEVRAFAQQLMSWADCLAAVPRPIRVLADADRHELVLALATAARAIARLRARIFPEVGFADPAWAIILEVYVREANGYQVTLDQLNAEDDLVPLTVYRCVNLLIDKGLMERSDTQSGEQPVRLSLSPTGRRKMTQLLLQSAEHARPHSICDDFAASITRTEKT